METTNKARREHWSKKREYILASAGNVVGLGNVWRFPYLCYKNGGGAFLLPYCFFAALCGVPLFLLETVIGQYTQEGTITCWTKVGPLAQGGIQSCDYDDAKGQWRAGSENGEYTSDSGSVDFISARAGYSSIVIQLYSRVYIIILAWALLYLIYCFRDPLPWATCNNPWNTDRCVEISSLNHSTGLSGNLTLNHTSGYLPASSASEFWERKLLSMSAGIEDVGTVQWMQLLCLLACWVASYFCIWKGVRSTGKVVYFTALFPYVMLLILLIRGLTLPGAWQGVVFYLYPDPSRLADLQVWIDACSQVLFSYGVSSGSLITLGSYNKVKNNCYRDSLWLCALNSGTSLVAGFAVFSALGFMAHKQGVPIDMVASSGPGLAFIAFPQAVAMMPLPQLWAVCFFCMLLMLGLDTVFTGLETITSSVVDMFPAQMRKPWRREIFLLLLCLSCFLIQISLTTEGGVYQFQLIDHYGSNGASVMFVGFLQCVAVGWAFGSSQMCDAVEDMIGQRPCLFISFCWRYFTPLLCLVCFICSFLVHQPLKSSSGYTYPSWAYALGWAMAFSTVAVFFIWTIGKILITKGPLRQRLRILWYPVGKSTAFKPQKELDGDEVNMKQLTARSWTGP